VLDVVKPLLSMPPAEQLAGLPGIVRDNPDSTVAAVSLMIALRQADSFAPKSALATGGGIPKTIMQYWDSTSPPSDILRLMETWRETNPGYRYRLFNDMSAQEFLTKHFPPEVLKAYNRGEYATQKSDIFRLAFLVAEGGIYADADDRCTAPVTAIIPKGARLVAYQDDHMTLCNNFIAAEPRHPVLLAGLEGAVRAMLRGDRDTVWFSTGPALLTRAFTQVLVACADVFDDIAASGIAVLHRTDRHWLNSTFARRKGHLRSDSSPSHEDHEWPR
jgi:hypothetical protein